MSKADTAQDVLMYAFAPNEEVLKANMGAAIKEAKIGDAGVTPTTGTTIDISGAGASTRQFIFNPGFNWQLVALYVFFNNTTSVNITVDVYRGTTDFVRILTDTAITDAGWRLKPQSSTSPGSEEYTSDYKLQVEFSQVAAKTAKPFLLYRRLA